MEQIKKFGIAFSFILLISLWGGQFYEVLAQSITVKGVVTDAVTKLPIDYAAVVAKGANLAEMTDTDGSYQINVAPGTTLEFSCLGYISKTVKVTSAGTVNVALETDAISLDAVVAIGYGTTKRSDVTGAVSSVTADELKAAPVATVDQAMQGRVAGVTVNAQSGQPGQAAQVRIRGIGTVNNSSPNICGGRSDNRGHILPQFSRCRIDGNPQGRLIRRHLRFPWSERRHHHHHEERS